MDPDELLRAACFRAVEKLQGHFGEDLPAREALSPGFTFDGRRVPFRNPMSGIYRSREQRGPAALSIVTTIKSPYDDEASDDGLWYAYRAGSIDHPDNRALRAAVVARVPLVYFVASAAGWYRPLLPCYAVEDDPHARRVRIVVGRIHFGDAELPADEIERRYAVRQARVRLHQGRFRGAVLAAYRERCAICRLNELRLLDAAHIARDGSETGVAAVHNGLSLCSIHHRAFDQNLVGVDPEYRIHVAESLLLDDDGPMLDLLKASHHGRLELPQAMQKRPSRELLAARFESFLAA